MGAPGRYLKLSRVWHTGDTIQVTLPFRVRVERALDRPDTQTLFNGPIVLCALSSQTSYRQFSLYKDVKLDGRIALPATGGTFTTNGHTLRPLYVGDTQAQHIYFRRNEPTVVFGTRNSGVPNRDQGDGITFLDAVWAQAPFATFDAFRSAVSTTSASWVSRGLYTSAERNAIMTAANAARPDLS